MKCQLTFFILSAFYIYKPLPYYLFIFKPAHPCLMGGTTLFVHGSLALIM